MSIHPTAIIEDGAIIGAGCVIHAQAMIKRHAVLDNGVVVHSYAVIGDDPQDLSFDSRIDSKVHIGARTVVREFVTVHRSTRVGEATSVGSDVFLMSGVHVGHDSKIADHVIMASNAIIAGHTQIGAYAFLGGGVGVHQFTRIGESAMVGGLARITRDVPPFTMATERDELIGLNKVGLRRRGFKAETIAELKALLRLVCAPTGNAKALAAEAVATGKYHSEEAQRFLKFFNEGRRGFLRQRQNAHLTIDSAE